jgi:RimJ/RimL family protein N-acetyltransferase
MISLELCDDLGLLESIAHDPAIWLSVHDDRAPDSLTQVNRLYLLVKHGDNVAGFFALDCLADDTVEVHTCLLPQFRGRIALDAGKALIDCVFGRLSQRKILTQVPVFNRSALVYAMKCGFIIVGINPESFMRGGVLYDQHMMSLSKGGGLCQ